MNDVTLEQALAALERDLATALRARDAEAAERTALRQHLDGAPNLTHTYTDGFITQYNRWFQRKQELTRGH